ncbi:MAG TPA: outer membrane lipid asymmetry maintenance protein MlaD [Burkholderiales bacterium]|jgi:phospholipid/cholesterol/gamma-HCH transport system substrate-binding protein
MDRKLTDLWVGMFVIAGVVAILLLALKAGNLLSFSFSETYQVLAKFDNIGGLKIRAPVKSAGVVVGRVASVGFDDQTYEAVVTLAMDKHYSFPKDTSAKILTSGLLGEQYIGLEPGGDSDKLAEGGKIKSTQSAIVLENLISQFLFSKAAEGKSDSNGQQGGGAAPSGMAPPGISAPPGINAPAGGTQGGK